MLGAFAARQAVTAALTANAVRPVRQRQAAVASFAAGWLTSELAPQLLALTAADTARAVRRGKAGRGGLLLAGLSAAGLVHLIHRASGAGDVVEQSLREGIGEDYRDGPLDDVRTPLRTLVRPFRMTDPGVEVLRDIHYARGGSRARLDVYRPKGVDLRDAPVLVQIHGGAWTLGSKEHQGLLLMNRMAAHGWVCVAVNYRLAPKHPLPTGITDVKRAIAWIRENIAEYGGDPSYLVVTGGSAGGHLAALAALSPHEKRYQPGFEDADTSVAGAVPFYGIYDMAGDDGDAYTRGLRDYFLGPRVFLNDPAENLDDYRLASPITHVSPDAPDFFVIHGTNDSLVSVRQARAFVARLREESKATVTYAELPGTQHAFEVFGSVRSHATIKAVQRWLEWHRAQWAA